MKIFCDGARFYGGQIDRIERGFVHLGHEMTDNPHTADLVYINDSSNYKKALDLKRDGKLSGKLILTVLDLPFHIPTFNYDKLQEELLLADGVCTISKYVQWQVESKLGLKSHVIYQPIKPIVQLHFQPWQKRFKFASIGRRSDANKRTLLWVSAMVQRREIMASSVILVGNEGGWGYHVGELTDSELNLVYNSVDFVFATGKVEGLNLPVIEAMAAGCIPVVCNDMTTREEILPPELFPEYNDVFPDQVSIYNFLVEYSDEFKAAALKKRLQEHYISNWQEKTSGAGVASEILKFYETL